MSIVYTGGTFDLLHAGHVDFLRVCKKVAGVTTIYSHDDSKVVVGLNRDKFVAKFKGAAPICSYAERKAVLLGCRYVDSVIENEGDEDSTIAISKVNPDFILIGEDWANRDYYKQMRFTPTWLAEKSITLLYVPRLRALSSTEIKARVSGG